jgi:hypothetical protein
MTAPIAPIKQALYHFEHKANYNRQQKFDASVELAEWGVYSNTQISRFTGLGVADVGALSGKTDRTGGNLPGEALPTLLAIVINLANGEESKTLVRQAVELGASTRMVAKLTGMNQRTVARWAMGAGEAAAA